jgi:predicted kinase
MKKTFGKFLTEAKDKGAVFTFGRFNPPTTGHAKLVEKLKSESNGYEVLLFSSHSNDRRKNPLSHRDKIKYLRKFFGKIVVDATARTVFDIANELQKQGYKKVRMVVGSDRVKEFEILLNKYNGVKARHGFYKFDKIEVISAGERDPEADDVSGMSASKMRAYAEQGDYENFKLGVPSRNNKDKEKLYKDIRKGMGIAEGTLPAYMYEDLITEGVYDPGTFKAVFFSGGPGSGKSTVVDALSLKALGLKLVNTDKAFELGLKKAGMTLDLRGADFDRVDPIRAKAKRVTGKGMDMYMDGRLGLIFDTTSANLSKIKQYKEMLDKIGYESKMIHVSTSLANAQKRNAERPRKLPPEIVEKDWNNSTRNMIALQRIFKGDFSHVSNDDDLKSLQTKANRLYSKLMSWTTSFPSNKLALKWRETELLMKKGSKDMAKKSPTDKSSPFGSNLKTFKSRKTGKKTVIKKI